MMKRFCLYLLALGLFLPPLFSLQAEADRLPFNPDSIPSPPAGDHSFRLAAISDLNASYGSTTYRSSVHESVALIQNLKAELVISAGDLVAGQKRGLEDEQIWAMWEGFTSAVTSPLQKAGIPFVPVAGNHDASGYPAFAREREIFQEHWQQADQKPDLEYIDDEHYPLHYSFSYKGAFFMVLDVTTMNPLSAELWEWMEQELAKAGDFNLRFASAHVPPYPIAQGREHEIIPAPDNDRLHALFVEHGLDVFLTGHHHAYYKGRKEGLNLVSLNCAGNGPRPLIGKEDPQPQSFLVIDVVDGKIEEFFSLESDGKIFSDETLPLELRHDGYVVPRFDR